MPASLTNVTPHFGVIPYNDAQIDNQDRDRDIRLIAMGATGRELLAVVKWRFPDLDRREFVGALQGTTASAEKRALRPD
jgi:hypothetical protein